MAEKETITDYLKKVSPGNPLRTAIDDLITSNMGALIVFHSIELESLIDGGFKVNCPFSPNKLFELCKLDGAVVISPDLKKILYANVLLTPDPTIETTETGTRHKAGERTAKQANTCVITVSERKNKTTLYLPNTKYFLKSTATLLNEVTSNLQLLEKQRELFDKVIKELDYLEITGRATVGDVCKVIQRAETVLRIAEMIKRYFTELGNVGTIISLRYKELIRGVEKIEDNILRDYSDLPLKKSKTLLSTFNFENLIDLDIIAKLMFARSLEENIPTRGYRFASSLKLTDKEVSQLINHFKTLDIFLESRDSELKILLKNRDSELVKKEIEHSKEQIFSTRRF
ncbi:MAG: DNA integrity scanning diadenylate cyclase DisA [Candidatus Pacearchaeota archaeon]